MRLLATTTLSSFVFVTLVSSGCDRHDSQSTGTGSGQPRLVVLYAPCSVAKRFLSPYNHEIDYTPHIESFAKQSTVFEKHRTEAGLSGIAYASILTGNQAHEHGVFAHPTRLADSNFDLTEAFAANGYETHFWNAQRMGAADLNYGQGVPPDQVYKRILGGADPDFTAILRRLGQDETKRAFLLVNFAVSHSPYPIRNLTKFLRDYPEEAKVLAGITKQEFNQYIKMYYQYQQKAKYDFDQFRDDEGLTDAELDKLVRVVELMYKSNFPDLDRLFGEVVTVIDNAGLGDDSLIAFTADHGESLYRPQAPFKWSHGHAVQSDVLDIPLMIRAPKRQRAATRCRAVSRSTDVFPTLVALARLKLPEGMAVQGYDLSKLMQSEYADPNLIAFSHSGMVYPTFKEPEQLRGLLGTNLTRYYPAADMNYTWVAARRGDMVWKYRPVEGVEPIFQAFDLSVDPAEATNVFLAADPDHQAMTDQLIQYKHDLVRAFREWGAARAQGLLDEDEQMKRLRSMGYIQ